MLRDVVGVASLPATPEHADPGPGEDPDRVGMITAPCASARVDRGGPRRGMTGVVRERRERLAKALVARPAEGNAAVFAGGTSHRGDAGFGGELFGGGKAGAVVAELGQDLRGVDLTTAGQALQERAIGVLVEGGRDGGGQLLDLDDERGEDGDERMDEFAAGLGLGVAGAADGGVAKPGQQLRRGAATAVGVAAEELRQAAFAEPLGALGGGDSG